MKESFEINIPEISQNRSSLKKQIHHYRNCFLCEYKRFCTLESKIQKDCMNGKTEKDLKLLIDFYAIIKNEIQHISKNMDPTKLKITITVDDDK